MMYCKKLKKRRWEKRSTMSMYKGACSKRLRTGNGPTKFTKLLFDGTNMIINIITSVPQSLPARGRLEAFGAPTKK